MSSESPVITIVVQRAEADCGIVVLAMYLGRTYEDVLVAAAQLDTKIHKRGMWVRQIEATALALGVKLRRRHQWDIDTSEGILSLNSTTMRREAHVVVLKNGLIFDTDGSVWEPDVFFATARFKPTILLERDER